MTTISSTAPPASTVYSVDSLKSAAPSTASATGTDGLGKDTFLKLMVAQLKYQDPLKPQDGGEYLTQTATFTSLETLQDIKTQLQNQASSSGISTASSLLGKQISYLEADGTTTGTGIVTGIKSGSTGVELQIGDATTTLDKVTEITTAPAANTAAAAAAAATTPATTPAVGTTATTATA